MKKLLYTGLVALTVLFSSCHGDLNVEQPSYITSNSMWTSESDAVSAVDGAYAQFRTAFGELISTYGDWRSNLYTNGPTVNYGNDNIARNDIMIGDSGTNWANIYTTINTCNLILKYAPEIKFNSESVKNEVLANAYFLRAYCYFTIARVWGDAPVLTSGFESDSQEDINPVRHPEAQVYAQVESDVTEAVKLMPTSVTSIKKANSAAVNMLAADYYLWKAKRLNGGNAALQSAQTCINTVLANGKFGLEADFAKIFGVENENGKEIIFAIDSRLNEYTSAYPSVFLMNAQDLSSLDLANTVVPCGSHANYVTITQEYEDFLFADPTDTRANVSFGSYQDVTYRWRWINKFKGTETSATTRTFDSDIIIYRFTEAVLMKAEVENALGNTAGAIAELNKIANRAYGDATRYSTLGSQKDIDNAIVDEILKEFVAENKAWWTMVRFGVAFERIETLKGKENRTNILLWPVAQACINTNPNITQTDGYTK